MKLTTKRKIALALAGDLRQCAQLVDSALAELALVSTSVAANNARQKLEAARAILRGES
ncbi:MAG TPA: hypothetical protein VKB59_15325 [Micromonosporaceae bacterium]|nr:hypothetical protein [Micromonosporaceae bacterium]